MSLIKIKGAVVFQDGDCDHWALKLMKKGFRHCFVCIEYGDMYIAIQGLQSYTDVEIVENIEEIANKDAKIIYFSSETPDNAYRAGLCYFSCVEVVKAHIGLKSFWTFTPYQLYKLMKDHDNGQ